MWGKVNKLFLVVPVMAVMYFSVPAIAQASWSVNIGLGQSAGGHYNHHRRLPHGYRTIKHHHHKYFYHNGIYYQGLPGNYIIVKPPSGVIVSNIPFGAHQVWINGRAYHEYNGIYYVSMLGGYRVVDAPLVVSSQSLVSTPASTTNIMVNSQDDLTVNIANSTGGYTPVILKKLDRGFTGPQGEYYPEFPPVAQLKAMYVK